MSRYRPSGAGPPYSFPDAMDVNMDFEMNDTSYLGNEHFHNTKHQPGLNNYSPTGRRKPDSTSTHAEWMAYNQTDYHNQYPSQWPSMGHQQINHSHHVSSLSMSSGNPSIRSSGNSIFSQDAIRDSWSSSFSTTSPISDSRDQLISQAEYQLTFNSRTRSSFAHSPIEGPTSPAPVPAPRKRSAPRQISPEKDFFKTCVSGTKQSRPCNKEQKYFCTTCKKLFVEKADWKRHEETYQERPEMFQCDLCNAIYFLDKDFAGHHVHSHRCAACDENVRCSKKRHVQLARRERMTRTGWGCGFCCHFSSTWTERCGHIAFHIEKEGKTIADWHHSCVIYSLLARPAIYTEWKKLLDSKRKHFTGFGWNQHSTGRVEGYPESNQSAQLQDQLEYYTIHDDARALVQLAYEKAVKRAAPPAPPPKDYPVHPSATLHDLRIETETWTQFVNSVIEDDFLPTNVCPLGERHIG